jgi:PAS domain S-box-containing protein
MTKTIPERDTHNSDLSSSGRTARFDPDQLLKLVSIACAPLSGEQFFRQLTQSLAQAMGARYAFICEYLESVQRVRDLAFWAGDTFQEPGEYDIDGTPCAYVLAGEVKCYGHDVATLFPKYKWLSEVGAESYLAVPLKNEHGRVLGHMGIMDTLPLEFSPEDLSVFGIFGARACVELERKQYQDALQASEGRVAHILDSAMDAIVAIGADRRITVFNPAAESIFGCAAAWAQGQPFDRFLGKPFRSLLEKYLEAAAKTSDSAPQWLPPNLTAVRANREEFAVEGTLSSFVTAEGQKLFTLILRDVNEQRRTQIELDRLHQQNVFLREEAKAQYTFEEMIGSTPVMKELFESLGSVAKSDATVLICGETGTGKEQIAHAVHNLSARKDKLLITMNCAALPSELIESEMFGHEKGAFTGATAQRKGRFELADGGTLFLDEVGELSLPAQAKLLRVLQEQEFERVGGTRTVRVDVRVIAATNRDLNEMVKAGTFRADLYYRLNVFPVRVPPLRERTQDIPMLVQHFLNKQTRKLGRNIDGIDAGSLQRLVAYPWPGNIRELQNVIERAAVLTQGPIISIRDGFSSGAPGNIVTAVPLQTDMRTLEEIEAQHIRGVLDKCEWKIEGKHGAATILGLEPSTLRYRMQKLGIKRQPASNDA